MNNVGIYIYDEAEVLDFSGPFEVFSTANRIASESQTFHVFLVSETLGPVTARGGYKVLPNYSFADHPDIDLLIVVGGVHTQEMEKPSVLSWISTQAGKAGLVASVCTGAFLLAASDVITNQKVTTHWEDIPDLAKSFPKLEIVENQRWVDAGSIVTSGGISAGIDMSLYLVSKLRDVELARRTARQMEFDWSLGHI